MFHKINNKRRFALGNTELSLILFNQFFYKHEDIRSFEIVIPKIKVDPEDEFYRSHIFQKDEKQKIPKIIDPKTFLLINFKKLNLIRIKKLIKTPFFLKNECFKKELSFELISSLNYFYVNTKYSFYTKKNIKSQSLSFLFFKKLHNREFFKQKVQMKNYTFNKFIVNVDIFSKKLNKKPISFLHNFSRTQNSLEKLNNLLVFRCVKERIHVTDSKFKISLNLIKNKIKCNNVFSWEITTNTVNFKKITKNFMLFFIKKKLRNTIVIHKNNRVFYKNIFIYNLIKLMSNRNNYLTNEFNNMTLFSNFKNFLNENTKNTMNYLPNFQNKYTMNNFLPYFNFFVKSKFYKNVLLRNILNPSFSLYYSYYLFNFLEIFLKKKIWLKINTKANSVISGKIEFFVNEVFRKNRSYQNSVGRHFYLLEFIEILYITLYYRDLKFFSYWFKKTMEKLHLKKHRKLIKVVQNTLKNNLEFLTLLNVKGFTMDVRGKLGTTGNSKKKHYAFTVGTMAPTSKNHDMSMNQTTVRTNTGVLGVTITLSY